MSHRLRHGVLVVALLAGAMLLSACSGTSRSTSPVPADDVTSPTTTEPAALTVGTTEGPYYVTGTAELPNGNLNAGGLPGEPIRVSGTVYSGGGTTTPIPGAKVEIWHADDAGTYHPGSDGPASQYDPGQLALRGYVIADETGHYEFTSIYPGYYQGRARHIHVRASAEGFGGVATQIIVPARPGDGTTPETDSIARSLPASYSVTFTDKGGVGQTVFDFHLGAD